MDYTVGSSVLFNQERESQLLEILTQYGEIKGTSGGFPVSQMVYHWEGTEEGAGKIKSFGATIKHLIV